MTTEPDMDSKYKIVYADQPEMRWNMQKKIFLQTWILFLLSMVSPASFAQYDDNGLGQSIQITTRFRSFVGKPSWLLVIRDVDHNVNIPYLFDISRAENFWIATTFSRNYTIVASTLQIETYRSRTNKFKNYKIHNFCNLESNGRIHRGTSMFITIDGDLSPDTSTFSCHVSKYADSNFTVVNQE